MMMMMMMVMMMMMMIMMIMMIMMMKLYKGNEEELESQVKILHGILQAQRQTAEHMMDKLVPENALSIIFDHRSRGVKAQESKPKVETLDLVCCDQTVRIPPLLVQRTFTFFSDSRQVV